jgi:hypothetical protein
MDELTSSNEDKIRAVVGHFSDCCNKSFEAKRNIQNEYEESSDM